MARRAGSAGLVARLPSQARLAVPVLGAAGGVGTSTVTALLAARLHRMLPPPRSLAVVDAAPAAASPWIAAQHITPAIGSSSLVRGARPEVIARALGHAQVSDGTVLVLADSNPPPERADEPLDLDPDMFHPLLAGTQCLVLDGGVGEVARLDAHARGGRPSLTHRWISFQTVATAVVWVAAPTPPSLAATITAVTNAERTGADPTRWVIAMPALAPSGIPRRAKADLTLLADRVAAICPIEHRSYLLREAAGLRELLAADDLSDATNLAAQVCAAAGVRTQPIGQHGVPQHSPADLTRKAHA